MEKNEKDVCAESLKYPRIIVTWKEPIWKALKDIQIEVDNPAKKQQKEKGKEAEKGKKQEKGKEEVGPVAGIGRFSLVSVFIPREHLRLIQGINRSVMLYKTEERSFRHSDSKNMFSMTCD